MLELDSLPSAPFLSGFLLSVLPRSGKSFHCLRKYSKNRPRLVMNRFRLAMKVLVSRFGKVSRSPIRLSLQLATTSGT